MRGSFAVLLFTVCLSTAVWEGAAGQGDRQQAPAAEILLVTTDTLSLPGGLVRGLAWLAPDTIAVLREIPDSLSSTGSVQVLLTYQDRRGNVFRVEDFSGTLARGLAFDGSFLWSCGDDRTGGSLLYKIEPDTCKVKEAFTTPGHRPCGVAWDGEFIWVVDRDSGRLDRFDVEAGQVTRSVLTPGFSPYGLAHVGRHSWIADSGTGRLYRLTGTRRLWSATVDVESFANRGREVVLASDGTFLWYALADSTSAYRVSFP